MAEIKELTPAEFREMQLLQLDMLVEFDRVCRENNIRYTIFGGTLLGAVRHKGYIPWDDDADVAMLREDYDKFKSISDKLDSDICYFQDHSTEPEYRWGYGKLRRTGTEYVRVGQEHLKCKTGVFIDVFPMDDVPYTLIGTQLQDLYAACLRKILWSEVAKESDDYSLPMHVFWTVLSKISVDRIFDCIKRMEKKSKSKSHKRVRTLMFPATGRLYSASNNKLKESYAMPKKWFKELTEYEFEGYKFMGTKDYDDILTYIYGDYMKLPPEDQRDPHAPVSSYSFDCVVKKGKNNRD